MVCAGCDEGYVHRHYLCNEEGDESEEYWPTQPKRQPPEWLHRISSKSPKLQSLLSDVYTAVNKDLNVLAAIGIRTSFDISSELLGVDPEHGFAQKVKELAALGVIGSEETDILKVLIDAGSAAAHRGWNPDAEELRTLLELMESFIYRTFILKHHAKQLKLALPQRTRKKSNNNTST